MKKFISLLVLIAMMMSAVMANAIAAEGGITLAELKEQVPQSVSFTINGESNDVPVILPEANTLPVLYAKQILLHPNAMEYTPQDTTTMQIQPSVLFSISAAPEGKSKRYPFANAEWLLLDQEMPENNLLLPSRPLEKAKEMLQALGANVDLRVLYQRATSRPYRAKEVADGDVDHPYRTHYEADTKSPISGYDQGYYRVRFAQYLNGVQVLGSQYYPEAGDESCLYNGEFLSMGMDLLAEDDFSFACGGLLQATDILKPDAKLAGFQQVIAYIQNRIDDGMLQNIFSIELCYQIMFEPTSDGATKDAVQIALIPRENETANSFFARMILVPTWKVLGFDLKDSNTFMEGYGNHPSTRLSCESDGRFQLRIDAQTAKPVWTMIYDKEGNVQ